MDIVNYLYSIPYVIVYVLLLILYCGEQRLIKFIHPKYCQYLAFFILLIFIGFRGHIGSDFQAYYPLFNQMEDIFDLKLSNYQNREPGFIIYTSLIKTIWGNYHFYVFINTLIDLLVLFWVFKKYSCSVVLSFILFFIYRGLQIEFDLFRNVKSILLFLLSVPAIQNRNFIKFLVLNLIGFSFHSSAIFYIPFYFILRKTIPLKALIILVVTFNVLYLTRAFSLVSLILNTALIIGLGDTANTKLIDYVAMDDVGVISLKHIERTIYMIIVLLLYKKLLIQKASNVIFINLFTFYYLLLMAFSEVLVFSQRFPLLCIPGYWIVLANIFSLKVKYKRMICGIILLLCSYSVVSDSKLLIRYYDNILWGELDYQTRKALVHRYYYNHG